MGSEIISGHFLFSKTVKTGDYENEKADCRLDFNVAEGDTHDAILEAAAAAARDKVLVYLGKKAPAATLPPQLQTNGKAALVAEAAAKTGAPASGTAVAEPAKPAKPPKPAARQVETPPAAPKLGSEAKDADDDMADLLGAAPAEITDAEMVKHITDTNARIKNAPALKAITAKYVAHPGGVKDIPQARRAEWMKELDALQPAS